MDVPLTADTPPPMSRVLRSPRRATASRAAGSARCSASRSRSSVGYSFTFVPLARSGVALAEALRITLAADTVSIFVMEAVDNLVIMLVPGAMESGLDSALFWASLAAGFAVAFVVTFPVNRWLISRGRGHAVVHGGHG